jgi:hypothetical protein
MLPLASWVLARPSFGLFACVSLTFLHIRLWGIKQPSVFTAQVMHQSTSELAETLSQRQGEVGSKITGLVGAPVWRTSGPTQKMMRLSDEPSRVV